MVLQAGPEEEPVWTIPGGRAEPGEFMTEALVREVAEETGIRIVDPGDVAFTVQMDNRREGWFATVWTYEAVAWEGELCPADPDGYVREAAWVETGEACRRLELISWHSLTVRYLQRTLEQRPLWFKRVHTDGREEWL
jgi:ADP-ribose pyrophosphatase YjhB (NUDIX family)